MADERLDIDGMIETLEVKIAAMQEAVASLRKVKDALGVAGVGMGSTISRGPAEITVDRFVGMSIVEAVEAYLKLVGRPARKTEDIIEALGQGGLQVSPASVTTLIWRSHNNDGPVVRAQKGHWGLAAWYPKRPPKLGRSLKEIVDDGIDTGQIAADELVDAVTEANDQRKEILGGLIEDEDARKGERPRGSAIIRRKPMQDE